MKTNKIEITITPQNTELFCREFNYYLCSTKDQLECYRNKPGRGRCPFLNYKRGFLDFMIVSDNFNREYHIAKADMGEF